MITSILKKYGAVFKSLIPRNRAGDNLLSFLRFVRSQRRLPFVENWLNDAYYKMKISNELERPLRVFTTDKEYAKLFIKSVVGERHCVPTLNILLDKDSVDSYTFPPRCCIKPTHSSRKYYLRKDDEELPLEEIKSWFDHNYYEFSRERNYKNLTPKVIVEPLVFDSNSPIEYAFHCNEGSVKIITMYFTDQYNTTGLDFDTQWNILEFWGEQGEGRREIHPRPANLDAMIEACEALARYFSMVRVDLYSDGEEFLVGEITHCDHGATFPPVTRVKEIRAASLMFS